MTKTAFAELLRKTARARRSARRLDRLQKCAAASGRAGYDAMLASTRADASPTSRLSTVAGYGLRHPVDLVTNYAKDIGRGAVAGFRRMQDAASRAGESVGARIGRAFGPRPLSLNPGAAARGAAAKSLSAYGIRPSDALRRANVDRHVSNGLDSRAAVLSRGPAWPASYGSQGGPRRIAI